MAQKTIYRIVKYEGDEEWLKEQLDRSSTLGVRQLPKGSVSVAMIDPEDKISVEIARNKFLQQEAKLTYQPGERIRINPNANN